ncbi:unnamed protein product, partial [Discosporangium mesarthrocarpum]
ENGAEFATAEELLRRLNPNKDKNNPDNLTGRDKRFCRFNGAIGAEQVAWMRGQLAEAGKAGQRVMAFGHVPLHPNVSLPECLLWNYEEVLSVLHEFDCVAAVITGHQHRAGYHVDDRGIHHLSLHAALETHSEREAFANFHVYSDRLELRGHGSIESRT